jgi:hypothetical protein
MVASTDRQVAAAALAEAALLHVCIETIYAAVYRGLIVVSDQMTLRTGRIYRHRRGRGRTRERALKQSTNMKTIHERPAVVESREQVGHWEGDVVIGAGLRAAIATLVERKSRLTLLVPRRAHKKRRIAGSRLRGPASRDRRVGYGRRQRKRSMTRLPAVVQDEALHSRATSRHGACRRLCPSPSAGSTPSIPIGPSRLRDAGCGRLADASLAVVGGNPPPNARCRPAASVAAARARSYHRRRD